MKNQILFTRGGDVKNYESSPNLSMISHFQLIVNICFY